jgi:hypothetical protein
MAYAKLKLFRKALLLVALALCHLFLVAPKME